MYFDWERRILWPSQHHYKNRQSEIHAWEDWAVKNMDPLKLGVVA